MKDYKMFKKSFITVTFLAIIAVLGIVFPVWTAPPSLSTNITGALDVEAGNPSSYQYTITVTNPHPTDTATNVVVRTTLPTNYTYTSTTSFMKGASSIPFSFSNSGGNLTWTPSTPMSLLPGESATVIFNLTVGCNAVTSQLASTIQYRDTSNTPDSVTSLSIDVVVKKGVLVFEKTPSLQSASMGDLVSWTVKTRNTGLATIYNVSVTDIVGGDFTNVSVVPDLALPAINLTGNTMTTAYTSIPAGSERFFTVTARVNGCNNLTNSVSGNWACNANSASANITFVPKPPDISFTVNGSTPPNNVNVDWANGVNMTVAISNNGTGPANAFKFKTTLNSLPVTVSNVGAGWSYNASNGIFTYTGGAPSGSLASSTTSNLTFRITLQDACNSTTIGTAYWTPEYTDECGVIFNPPISLSTFSTVNTPTITIDKVATKNIVISNESFSYTATLGVTQQAYFNGNIVVTDNVPSLFTVNSVSASAGTASHTGQAVTWSVPPALANTATLTINVTTSGDNCVTGGAYTNSMTATGTTGPGPLSVCTINASDAETVYIASLVPGVIDFEKTIDPSITTPAIHPTLGFEKCNSQVGYLNEIDLQGSAVGTFAGSVLIEKLNNGQTYVAGSAEYSINSAPYAAVPGVRILSTSPTLTIDLGFVPNPVSNKNVRIRYKLNQINSGTFISESETHLEASADGCVPASTTYTDLDAAVNVTTTEPEMTVGINAPSVIDDCQTFPVTLNVGKNGWIARNNISVSYDTTNYTYLGSPVYSGFDGLTPTVTTNASNVTFSFGSNNLSATGSGTITFNVKKKCGNPFNMSSGVTWRNACGDTLNATGTFSPSLSRSGTITLDVSPSAIYAPDENISWFIYAKNSGTGVAYDVDISNAIGANLRYLNDTGSVLPIGSSFTAQPVINTNGAATLTWSINQIAPGKTVAIKVNTKIIGLCGADVVSNVSGRWCAGTACQTIAPIAKPVITVPVSNVVTTVEKVTPLKLCGTSTVRVLIKDAGQTNVYNLLNNTDLPAGMCYVAGTGKVKINNAAYTPITPTISGQRLTWSFGSSLPNSILSSITPNDTAYIEFDVKGTCGMEINDIVTSETFYAKPCEIDFRGGIGTGTTGNQSAIGSLAMQTQLPNIDTALTPSIHTVVQGQSITWLYTATNISTQVDAQNVKLKFTLPSSVTYSPGTTSPAPNSVSGQELTFNLANLVMNGGTVGITVGATVNAGSCSSTDAPITTELSWGCPSGTSCTGADCTTPALVKINAVSLRTKPTLSGLSFPNNTMDSCGASSHFFINFSNTGSNATNFQVQDTLPTGLVFDSSFAPIITASGGGSYTLGTSPVNGDTVPTWMFSTLNKGDYSIEFKVKAAPSGTCFNTSANNRVDISYIDSCGNSYTEPSFDTLVSVQKPIVSLADSRTYVNYVSIPAATPLFDNKILIADGGNVTFELKFKNTGNAALTNFTVTDVIGTSFKNDATLVFSNGSDGTTTVVPSVNLGTRTATWSNVNVAAGATWTATVTAQHVGSNNTSNLTNVVTLDGGCGTGCKFESGLGALPYSQTAYVALLDTFSKTIVPTTATIGEHVPVTITSTYSGTGVGGYTNVRIRDLLPKSGVNPLMLINGTPSIVDTAGNTWTYTAPAAGNSYVASWVPATPATFTTPTTVTITFDAYVNNFNPSTPVRGDILTNSADTDFTYNAQNFTRTSSDSITVQEPSLSRNKARILISAAETGSVATVPQATTIVGGTQLVGYRIDLTNDNNANCSTAHDINILDTIPAGMRDTAPSIVVSGVQLINVTTSVATPIPNTQYTSTFVPGTGDWNLSFLSSLGFNGIPKDHRLRIDYFATVDSDVSANRTGANSLTNSLYLAKTTTGGVGNEGYSSLPSTDTTYNPFDRKYENTTAVSVSVTTPDVGRFKALTTNVNESGNNTNTEFTPGETVTYRVVFGTANIASTDTNFTGYGTPLGTPNNNASGLDVTAFATTSTTAAPLAAAQPAATFLDVLPDGLDVDTTNATITVASGSTDIVPTLSFTNNNPSAGRTRVHSNAFTMNPDTVIVVTIPAKVRKTLVNGGANIVSGNTISNGGSTAANYTRVRFRRSEISSEAGDKTTGTVIATVTEPNIPSLTKTKVSPVASVLTPGEIVTFQLQFTVANGANRSVAHNVLIKDTLPLGMRSTDPIFVSESTPIATVGRPVIPVAADTAFSDTTPVPSYKFYDASTGVISWFYQSLNPGTTVTIQYSAKVTGCGDMTNNASISQYMNLANAVNNSAGRKTYGPVTSTPVTVSVPSLNFQPNHTLNAVPGDVVILPHMIIPCNSGTANLTTTNDRGWVYTLHQDLSLNHDGSSLGPVITSIPVTAGVPTYIAAKVSIPENTPDEAVDTLKITATETISGIPHTATVTDVITVTTTSNGLLQLTKSLDKSSARPGEDITYTVVYKNIGASVLNNINLKDLVPEHTTFVSAAIDAPATGTITAPAVGATGEILWNINGLLPPGASGSVQFTVKID